MNTISKILTYILLLLLVVGGGFLTGRHLSTPKQPLSAQDQERRALKEEKKLADEQARAYEKQIENADYLIAKPSYGPLITTSFMEVDFGGDAAFKTLLKEEAENIKINQNVILFDLENYVLPLGGLVTSVEEINSEEVKIVIALPEGTNTKLLLNDVAIITMETKISQRLPLDALQTDENGENYVWRATLPDDNKGKSTISRVTINKGLTGDNFFEETSASIDTNDFIVINPNDKIRSDKKYNLVPVVLNAPQHNPIKAAWIDFELYRLDKQQEELLQIAEDCKNGVIRKPELVAGMSTLSDGTTSYSQSSCGGVTSKSDPLEIFNALTKGGTLGSGGCGGGCGQ